jgi:hypothetical protein
MLTFLHADNCMAETHLNQAELTVQHVLPAERHMPKTLSRIQKMQYLKELSDLHPSMFLYLNAWAPLVGKYDFRMTACWFDTLPRTMPLPSLVLVLPNRIPTLLPKTIAFTRPQFEALFNCIFILPFECRQFQKIASAPFSISTVLERIKKRFTENNIADALDFDVEVCFMLERSNENMFNGQIFIYMRISEKDVNDHYASFQSSINMNFHDLIPNANAVQSPLSAGWKATQRELLRKREDDLEVVVKTLQFEVTKGGYNVTANEHHKQYLPMLQVYASHDSPILVFSCNTQLLTHANEVFYMWNETTHKPHKFRYTGTRSGGNVQLPILLNSIQPERDATLQREMFSVPMTPEGGNSTNSCHLLFQSKVSSSPVPAAASGAGASSSMSSGAGWVAATSSSSSSAAAAAAGSSSVATGASSSSAAASSAANSS